jgi:L-Ala-D/L-Glu epimerase
MAESRVALTAAAHVVASQKNIVHADLDSGLPLFLAIDPVIGGVQYERSTVHLPSSPGLGLDVDPAFVKKLRSVV